MSHEFARWGNCIVLTIGGCNFKGAAGIAITTIPCCSVNDVVAYRRRWTLHFCHNTISSVFSWQCSKVSCLTSLWYGSRVHPRGVAANELNWININQIGIVQCRSTLSYRIRSFHFAAGSVLKTLTDFSTRWRINLSEWDHETVLEWEWLCWKRFTLPQGWYRTFGGSLEHRKKVSWTWMPTLRCRYQEMDRGSYFED